MNMLKSHSSSRDGFTIVELLIVIVVIAILAAITIISFNGVQKRAYETTLSSDLRGAASALEIAYAEAGAYPETLPASIKTSPKVTLTLKASSTSGGIRYDNLTANQNGVLFHDTCLAAIAAGHGAKADEPGRPFVSNCTVEGKTALHINGWNGRAVTTDITEAKLETYVTSYSGGSAELFKEKARGFMTAWKADFIAKGGAFPVKAFWDPWATPTNGGTMKPTLPTPTQVGGGTSDGTTFCLEARHSSAAKLVRHVRNNDAIKDGPCA